MPDTASSDCIDSCACGGTLYCEWSLDGEHRAWCPDCPRASGVVGYGRSTLEAMADYRDKIESDAPINNTTEQHNAASPNLDRARRPGHH